MRPKAVAALVCLGLACLSSPRGAAARAAQVEASDADLVRLSGGHTMRIGSPGRGREPVTLPLELYVAQVLAAEGEPNAADGAEQTLAVAIRTYALFNTGRHQKEGFDLCDTTHCQVLRGSTATTRRAVLATAGLVLTYQGAPADVYYSASCGGRTERAADVWPKSAPPYLDSVDDDVHDADPSWTFTRTLDELREALARSGVRGRHLEDVVVETRTVSGRAGRVALPGLTPDTMNGNEFRLAVGPTELRSTAFTLTRDGDRLTFVGKGYGHGVGMCVIGAGRRAARGETATAILARYYPGLTIATLDAPPGVTDTQVRSLTPGSAPAAAVAAPPIARPVVVVKVPGRTTIGALELEQTGRRAYERLSSRLGLSTAPITIDLHDTIEGFSRVTRQPWWVSAVVRGARIDLAPAPLLAQRDGVERTVENAIAEALVAPALADRPVWVRVGAARYFAGGERARTADERLRCPSDADLTAAVSAAAQREAESRAEACFAQALGRNPDWRAIR